MDQLLTDLFDLQRFAESPSLQSVIDEVEARYGIAINDEALENLSAAGEPEQYYRELLGKDLPK